MNKPIKAIVSMLEESTVSAWIIDDEQNIVYMNRLMQELFGNLVGKKATMIYECGSCDAGGQPDSGAEGSTEVTITDVPFRRLSNAADFGADGKYHVETFEDISEQKLIQNNMAQTLAKLNAETKMARAIQNSILPVDDTYWNTIAFSSLYMPADDLGGDFYDLIKLNDDEYLIYIADVSGHGIQASLLTIFIRERVHMNMEIALEGTAALLSKLVHDFNALDIDSMIYVTMALCKYTKSRRELLISNAGHGCYPLIIRNSGRAETIPTRGMPVCAIAGDFDYDEEIVSMNPGDRLVLFTDGIVEEVDSTRGKAFGAEGVRELAEKYHEYNGSYLARTIIDESAKYSLISAKDDRSILVADILS
ncbi:MAG: SpoIIE family protein phosphatase [Clostridiales Family XIII bacterium]|jgi:sigma-B regulation protein RsbU (phosphoserine phosphatase)|nr:SpoIIE family protein phosphatase [Clostridiales Family XIII bacterium]